MEIGLNKLENTKPSEFVSFSIREYVAEMRKKAPEKCWPFGSLCDPVKYDVFASYESVESSFLCSQNCPHDHIDSSDDKPEHKEASNSFNKEPVNGKHNLSQFTDMIEYLGTDDNMSKRINNGYPDLNSCKVIYKAKNGPENSVSGSGDDEPGRNDQPRRKHHKIRLLSDILRSLDNINKTKTKDDELDAMITLDTFSRKQKAVEVTTLSKKKMKTDGTKEPKSEKEEKSKCGSKDSHGNDSDVVSGLRKTRIDDMDSQPIAKRKKIRPPEENCIETANEDSEMEAVMLLAMRFNEDHPLKIAQMDQSSLEASNTSPLSSSSGGNRPESGQDQGIATVMTACACVQKKVGPPKLYTSTLSKNATGQDPTVYLECSINRNPADFSTPNAANVFMRGG